jgi:RecQ family ATP-dependent DNA helicase
MDNQESIISHILSGQSVFVLMPTGGGKSLCYQLPAMMMEGTAIVVSPLIALMKNQVDALRNFIGEESVAYFLNSSLSRKETQEVREMVLQGKTKLLYLAPESLGREDNLELLRQINISFFAIDEAHCISEWGHDFRPEYRRIRSIISSLGNMPIMALTATATPKVRSDILKNLEMTDVTVFLSSFNRRNLYYEVRPKMDVDKYIIRYIRKHREKSGIIYCLSRKKVEELTKLLLINGIKALPYHAGLDAAMRSEHQDKFLMEEADIIVATIAFGMGIDKPNVRFVMHYDMPKSLEGYYQETGRAGRDNGYSECIAFYHAKDIQRLEKLIQRKLPSEQETARQLLAKIEAYAKTTGCRRQFLLQYFGENYNDSDCKNCDNCRQLVLDISDNDEDNDINVNDDNAAIVAAAAIQKAEDDELFADIKHLLFKMSKELNEPPYVIFSEASLRDMVKQLPVTLQELSNCQGVGVGKAQKFGEPFLNLIRQYVESHNIARTSDMVVKSLINKSSHKVLIIQSIDKKIDLKDIAKALKISFNDLLTEMETIVHSGTKLNIAYHLMKYIDEEKQQDIIDYFMYTAQSDSMKQAVLDLESIDCDEEEIRLVRLQFLSEHGR